MLTNRRGFTLVEILSVIVIIAVLSAVLYPVMASAKLKAKTTAVGQNLKGFWQGLMIYEGDYDSKTEFGTPEDMGLPSVHYGWMNFVNQYTVDNRVGWETKKQFLPCGIQDDELKGLGLAYMPNFFTWPSDVQKLQEKSVVIFDKNCNLPGTKVLCQFCKKRSIGITLGGQIRDRMSSNLNIWDQRFYQ